MKCNNNHVNIEIKSCAYYSYFLKHAKFTSVSNTDNLRSAMATYYDFFSKNTESSNPIISVPYIDAAGLGKFVHLLHFSIKLNTTS